ncbi:MAG TPA: aminotransferase class IV [Stellaceae bacterium]|nr:aminotransferase class IV [Stellaceae bacterium]
MAPDAASVAAPETQALSVADPSAGIAFCDGKFVPISEAKISVLDFGFTRSDVTYDVVHVWNGKFFRLEAHLDRFLASMKALRLAPAQSREEMRQILIECVRRSGLRNSFVGMVCTRGRPPVGSRDMRLCTNQFIAYAIPFIWIADPEKQQKGLNAIVSSYTRIPPQSVDPRIKNYHWLDMVRSQWEAYDRGAEVSLLLDLDGNVTEGPGFNVFIVENGEVSTPDAGTLEGITRRTVLDLCAELGLKAKVRKIPVSEIRDADEIFLSSTAGGILPVTRLDNRILGNGAPGAMTMRLREAYWTKHDAGWEATPVQYE